MPTALMSGNDDRDHQDDGGRRVEEEEAEQQEQQIQEQQHDVLVGGEAADGRGPASAAPGFSVRCTPSKAEAATSSITTAVCTAPLDHRLVERRAGRARG